MQCPFCQTELGESVLYCYICGNRIPRCSTCGAVLREGLAFCTKDGTPVPEDVIALYQRMRGGAGSPTPAPAPRKKDAKQKKGSPVRRTMIYLLVVLVVLLVIAVAATLYLVSQRNSRPAETSPGQASSADLSAEDAAGEEEPEALSPLTLYTQTLTLEAGETEHLLAAVAPYDTALLWESDDPTVASVDAMGYVTGVAPGSCTVTVSVAGQPELAEHCTVTVTGETPAEETDTDTEEDPDARIQDFILNASVRIYSADDLAGFDADMCRKARNGIYALHGRKFASEDLSAYFSQYDWYAPTVEAADFTDDLLNALEIENIRVIRAYESAHGYNQG